MKDLLKTNCFDIQETMIIVGSCLDRIQPKAYEELEKISSNISFEYGCYKDYRHGSKRKNKKVSICYS